MQEQPEFVLGFDPEGWEPSVGAFAKGFTVNYKGPFKRA